MKISVLIENYYKKHDRKLKCEHGLSLYIEIDGKNILFDTGDSNAFMENARQMNIDLEKVDIVVISHAHSDHTGGLETFLKLNKKAKVYMSEYASSQYYFKKAFIKKYIGIPKEIFENHMERITLINAVSEIAPNIYLVPNSLERPFSLGESGKDLYVQKEDKMEKDEFQHEMSLVIEAEGKLDIITGCSHNGITNMVENVTKHFTNTKIKSVIGGFHLMGVPFKDRLGETPEYIENLGEKMATYNIEQIYTVHCTGKKAYKILKDSLGENISYLHTGDKIEV